ncbi:hypothetical protein BC833DRAFT_581064 [Globomyces pollinis-pini]|nr:hypothetical protein BC833DRAFT_581064 [Globomyces pollinis-pini]
MYQFNLLDTSAKNPSANATWPSGYKLMAKSRPLAGGCQGTVKVPLRDECCASSIELDKFDGFESASTIALGDREASTVAPISANGGTFCFLESSSNSSLLTYSKIWYQANGKCIKPDSVICNSDGTLQVYANPNCSGDLETFSIKTSKSDFSSKKLGSFSGTLKTLNEGKIKYSWTIIQPLSKVLPDMRFASDVIMIILYFISWVSLAGVMAYLIKKYSVKRNRYTFGLLLSQFFWFGWLSVRIIVSFSEFTILWDALMYALLLLASLTAIINITWTFFLFLNVRNLYRMFVVVGILVIHVALVGGQYFRFTTVSKTIDIWRKTGLPYWMIFMFAINCSLPVYVAFSLLRVSHDTFIGRARILLNADPLFCIAIVFQLLNAVFYFAFSQVRDASDLLGGDRAWLAGFGIIAASLALHCVLNYILISQMDHFIANKSLFTSSIGATSKAQKSTK